MVLFSFICAIIGYIGIIRMHRRLHKRGKLTEGIFVLFQVPIWSLLVLVGTLMISTSFEGIMMGVVLSVLCSIIGYPVARRIYRQRLAAK